ncbi:MAG TPA: hypothetical protein VMG59_08280 [Phycisphaerae bacterium]|nr:hypothetical protein [Phycisphaerae bacterium]
MPAVDDWDYWIRATRHGNFAFLDQVVCYYYRHENNAGRAFKIGTRTTRLMRYKAFFSPENTPEQKDLMKRYYRAQQREVLAEKWARCCASFREGKLPAGCRDLFPVAGRILKLLRGFPNKRG